MILQTVQIENFRKFKKTSIEFPEGIIGVVGLNGVGKSTLFEAIAWALYGSSAARTSSEDIKRHGAEPSSPCRVVVTFLFEGSSFRVVREMTGKAMAVSATVLRNDQIAATGSGPSSRFIQKTLGMDYKSFFTSIYARQNELNTLSSMNASERRPLILRMLGIDTLDVVIKNINTDKRSKASLVTHLEKNLNDKDGNSKEDALRVKKDGIKVQKNEVQQEIKTINESVREMKKRYNEMKKEANHAQKFYEQTNKEYERIIEQKTSFEEKKKLDEEINTILQKIKKRDEQIVQLSEKEKKLKDVSSDIKKSEMRLEEIKQGLTDLLKKNEQKKASISHHKKHIEDVHKKQSSIEKIGPDAPCPTCERTLGDQFSFLISNYNKDVHTYEEQINLLQKEADALKTKRDGLQREHDALQKKISFLRKTETEQQKMKTTIQSLTSFKKENEEELAQKKKRMDSYKNITFDQSQYQSIQEERRKYYKEYKQKLKQLTDQKDALNKHVLSLEKKQSALALLTQQIKNIDRQLKELKQMAQQIKQEQEQVTKLNMLRDVMMSFRIHLVSRIRPALSHYASSFFHDLTDGKYPEVTLDENYNIYIYDEGEKYTIQRFSGGEIDLANLCLRLAISDVITERAEGLFHFIILDEIFGSQDVIRQQNIMEQLYRLSSKYKQIFLITHVEQVKHFMQHIMHIQEINGLSTIDIN
jgi:DNA repair protein SbcC/Rad50